jgi:hypothetical protein
MQSWEEEYDNMKKTFGIAAVITLGLLSHLGAQEPPPYAIRVEIASDPIDLAGLMEPSLFPLVRFNTINLSNRGGGQPCSVVWNNGYASVDYTVQASIPAGDWTLGSTPGVNVACLSAVFAEPLSVADDNGTNSVLCRDLTESDFASDDILLDAAIRASSTSLARNAAGPEFKGYNVRATDSRRVLRYRLATPADGSASPKEIVITIGAVDSSS